MHIVNLGEHFKEYRLEHKLTQKEFAEKLGISKQMLSIYERKKAFPTLAVVMRFIYISGAKVDEIEAMEKYICKLESPVDRSALIEVFGELGENLYIPKRDEFSKAFFDGLLAKMDKMVEGVF